MTPEQKISSLKKIISGYGSCLVAFSGGLDSTFLLKVASLVLPREKLLAVTANSATYPKKELVFSRSITQGLKVRHRVVNTQELKDRRFTSNPIERCYFCKLGLFKKLKKIASREGLKVVVDASNISDDSDYRPGRRALNELKVRSPLKEALLSKEDIRKLSKKLGLLTWNKASQACLASRVPYGRKITLRLLRRIEEAESLLGKLGFMQARVRDYQALCRIEVLKEEIPLFLKFREQVVDKMKKLGYNYVTLDLEGFRSGSINEVIR
ncbi:MAG TPA: ATP-dependent sacrificial sulfur transferase LarE [Candidatus Margulisiibacteriota bacterium]|nr:ATP-dependent sacrificial sulfur transferase LarE [Candidatus Margulisiibacteriota bacterium]